MKYLLITILFIFLTGIIYSLSGVAKPQLRLKLCGYTDTPVITKNNNCGPAICHGEIQCNFNDIKYTSIRVHCEAQKAKLPRYSLPGPLPKGFWYGCPAPEECADPKIDRAFQIIRPKYYRIVEFGIGKKVIIPSDSSFTPILIPSKRKEPEDTGSTQ